MSHLADKSVEADAKPGGRRGWGLAGGARGGRGQEAPPSHPPSPQAPALGADPTRPPSRPEFQPRARRPGGPRAPGGAAHSQVNEPHGGAPMWPRTLRALASRGAFGATRPHRAARRFTKDPAPRALPRAGPRISQSGAYRALSSPATKSGRKTASCEEQLFKAVRATSDFHPRRRGAARGAGEARSRGRPSPESRREGAPRLARTPRLGRAQAVAGAPGTRLVRARACGSGTSGGDGSQRPRPPRRAGGPGRLARDAPPAADGARPALRPDHPRPAPRAQGAASAGGEPRLPRPSCGRRSAGTTAACPRPGPPRVRPGSAGAAASKLRPSGRAAAKWAAPRAPRPPPPAAHRVCPHARPLAPRGVPPPPRPRRAAASPGKCLPPRRPANALTRRS